MLLTGIDFDFSFRSIHKLHLVYLKINLL